MPRFPDSSKKVLISGASIAGPTLAFWLDQFGFEVTVVERSASLRLGGQNIDIKGAAKKVIRWMGVEEAIRAADTGEKGVLFVNAANKVRAAFPKGSGAGLTSEIEIIRGDLVKILYDRSQSGKNNGSGVNYLFGDSITALSENESDVTVTFASGKTDTFSLVIAADGFRSRTRQRVMGDAVKYNFLKLYTAYLTIPRAPTDSQWARWYTAPGGRLFIFRPDQEGTTRASFTFWCENEVYNNLPLEERRRVLKEKLNGAGWEAARLIHELDWSEDVYFDTVSQVQATAWSKGRFAIVGDAAYCPTPLTGMGTSLALVGAYVLAGELARHEDHREAFAAYETLMRPYVDSIQDSGLKFVRLVYPQTRLGVAIFNTIAAIVASKPVQALFRYLSSKKNQERKSDEDEGIALPDYASLEAG